jgi:hypothetical protein
VRRKQLSELSNFKGARLTLVLYSPVIHESIDCSRFIDVERLHAIQSLAIERQMHAGLLRRGASTTVAL